MHARMDSDTEEDLCLVGCRIQDDRHGTKVILRITVPVLDLADAKDPASASVVKCRNDNRRRFVVDFVEDPSIRHWSVARGGDAPSGTI